MAPKPLLAGGLVLALVGVVLATRQRGAQRRLIAARARTVRELARDAAAAV